MPVIQRRNLVQLERFLRTFLKVLETPKLAEVEVAKVAEVQRLQILRVANKSEVLRNFVQHAEVEAAEVAEVQRLQILRVANKLSNLEVLRNYVQFAEVEVAEVADAEVTNSLSCRQVQQVVSASDSEIPRRFQSLQM
ncbi:hypothetical protein B0H13DRAFT_1900290 [Mycena leptocephala]|nr:hypothetical protein B0H13DRAFT_1900290 [Mycena leptocephala]